MRVKPFIYVASVMVGCCLSVIMPAWGRGPGRGGAAAPVTPISTTYKGLTTTRSYQPIPTTEAGPATQGGPTVVAATHPAIHVEAITDDLRRRFRIDPFYTKTLTIGGIVIVGSDKVSDWAFLEAAYTLDHQLHDSPPWVHDALLNARVRLAILAIVEYTMDLPENNRNGQNSGITEGAYQDRRSRGLGGSGWCSCAEENLLNLRGDPYGGNGRQGSGENITIHEFSHTVASAIGNTQSRNGPFWTKLNKALADAMATGGRLEVFNRNRPNDPVYASTNAQEYWAEGAQAWFDNANPGNSGGLSVRDDVKKKDPELAALLTEVYGDGTWRYFKTTAQKPDGTPLRPPAELEHLTGLDALRNQFPVFDYNRSPRAIAAAATRNAGRGAPAAPASSTASQPRN